MLAKETPSRKYRKCIFVLLPREKQKRKRKVLIDDERHHAYSIKLIKKYAQDRNDIYPF